jgi:hypothetical protein
MCPGRQKQPCVGTKHMLCGIVHQYPLIVNYWGSKSAVCVRSRGSGRGGVLGDCENAYGDRVRESRNARVRLSIMWYRSLEWMRTCRERARVACDPTRFLCALCRVGVGDDVDTPTTPCCASNPAIRSSDVTLQVALTQALTAQP